MSPEIEKLCLKYKLTALDGNNIYYYFVADNRAGAVEYIQAKVGKNYKIAEMIVDAYAEDHREEIEHCKETVTNYRREKQLEELLNKPKCPTCQSTNIKKISTTSKALNTAMWGIFGTKRYKTFHCNHCGYEW